MAPPKKDAFADLFLSAAGSGLKSSLNNSMNKLSLQEQLQLKKPPSSLSPFNDWDVLSGNSTPIGKPVHAANQVLDPFAAFESRKTENTSKSSAIDDDLLFGLGGGNQPSKAAQPPTAPQPQKASVGNLLDDDFTDAFTPQPEPEPLRKTEPEPQPKRPISRESATSPAQRLDSGRDSVLAGLVDIGFSVDASNKAIDQVGPDLQGCVNFIMRSNELTPSNKRVQSPRYPPRPSASQQGSQGQSDFSNTLQDLSTDMFKKASWFLAKSKESVSKNIEQFQNSRDRTGQKQMPAWMRQQSEYKERALERKKDGTSYEDYGSDAENIDEEEIQRIMRLQKQREKERHRQRLEKLKEGFSGSKSKDGSLSPQPPMPRRPSLTSTSRSQRQDPPAEPRPVSQPVQPSQPEPQYQPEAKKHSQPQPEEDLLGLGDTPSQRFKASQSNDVAYTSPARRRPAKSSSKPRNTTSEALNAFQQSDYETFKQKGTESFTNGNYDDAFNAYNKCLESLPQKHELRIVIMSNLAITNIKLGNYKLAKQQCDDGIALVGDNFNDENWTLNDKSIKYWYIKLLTRKAESLEMLENFTDSLECYIELVSKHGVTEKKIMDAKRRVNNIINPPKPVSKKPARLTSSTPVSDSNAQVQKIRKQNLEEKRQEELKLKLHDQVHEKVQAWSSGKEDNLRNLLMSLSDVLPQRLGFPFVNEKKITINDLMLTKKVKINYMKVISAIHPDKLGKFELEDQMICQAVFIILNKAWDTFKEQNNIA